MRPALVLFVIVLACGQMLAGYSGTYTIKPDGSGDFLGFWEAADSLRAYGVSGHCVFEAYNGDCGIMHLTAVATDTFTLTFRPAEGQDSVLAQSFEIYRTNNVKIVGLTFYGGQDIRLLFSCDGVRVEGCRLRGIELNDDCDYDTVLGNELRYLVVRGSRHLAANNFLRGEESLIFVADLGEANLCRFQYNTIYGLASSIDACLCIQPANSARNNIVILGPEEFRKELIDDIKRWVKRQG
jgi:hypothetical protein